MNKRRESTSDLVTLMSGLVGSPICSSPDIGRLLVAVEHEFDLVVPGPEADKVRTVGDLQASVVAELKRLGRPAIDSGHVLERIKNVIAGEWGLKPSKVTPNLRLD